MPATASRRGLPGRPALLARQQTTGAGPHACQPFENPAKAGPLASGLQPLRTARPTPECIPPSGSQPDGIESTTRPSGLAPATQPSNPESISSSAPSGHNNPLTANRLKGGAAGLFSGRLDRTATGAPRPVATDAGSVASKPRCGVLHEDGVTATGSVRLIRKDMGANFPQEPRPATILATTAMANATQRTITMDPGAASSNVPRRITSSKAGSVDGISEARLAKQVKRPSTRAVTGKSTVAAVAPLSRKQQPASHRPITSVAPWPASSASSTRPGSGCSGRPTTRGSGHLGGGGTTRRRIPPSNLSVTKASSTSHTSGNIVRAISSGATATGPCASSGRQPDFTRPATQYFQVTRPNPPSATTLSHEPALAAGQPPSRVRLPAPPQAQAKRPRLAPPASTFKRRPAPVSSCTASEPGPPVLIRTINSQPSAATRPAVSPRPLVFPSMARTTATSNSTVSGPASVTDTGSRHLPVPQQQQYQQHRRIGSGRVALQGSGQTGRVHRGGQGNQVHPRGGASSMAGSTVSATTGRATQNLGNNSPEFVRRRRPVGLPNGKGGDNLSCVSSAQSILKLRRPGVPAIGPTSRPLRGGPPSSVVGEEVSTAASTEAVAPPSLVVPRCPVSPVSQRRNSSTYSSIAEPATCRAMAMLEGAEARKRTLLESSPSSAGRGDAETTGLDGDEEALLISRQASLQSLCQLQVQQQHESQLQPRSSISTEPRRTGPVDSQPAIESKSPVKISPSDGVEAGVPSRQIGRQLVSSSASSRRRPRPRSSEPPDWGTRFGNGDGTYPARTPVPLLQIQEDGNLDAVRARSIQVSIEYEPPNPTSTLTPDSLPPSASRSPGFETTGNREEGGHEIESSPLATARCFRAPVLAAGSSQDEDESSGMERHKQESVGTSNQENIKPVSVEPPRQRCRAKHRETLESIVGTHQEDDAQQVTAWLSAMRRLGNFDGLVTNSADQSQISSRSICPNSIDTTNSHSGGGRENNKPIPAESVPVVNYRQVELGASSQPPSSSHRTSQSLLPGPLDHRSTPLVRDSVTYQTPAAGSVICTPAWAAMGACGRRGGDGGGYGGGGGTNGVEGSPNGGGGLCGVGDPRVAEYGRDGGGCGWHLQRMERLRGREGINSSSTALASTAAMRQSVSLLGAPPRRRPQGGRNQLLTAILTRNAAAVSTAISEAGCDANEPLPLPRRLKYAFATTQPSPPRSLATASGKIPNAQVTQQQTAQESTTSHSNPTPSSSPQSPASVSPLFLAIKVGSAATVAALLDAGASATARDAAGRTALHIVFLPRPRELMKALCGGGAGVAFRGPMCRGGTRPRINGNVLPSESGCNSQQSNNQGTTVTVTVNLAQVSGLGSAPSSAAATPRATSTAETVAASLLCDLPSEDASEDGALARIVELLCGRGASVEAHDVFNRSPTLYAAEWIEALQGATTRQSGAIRSAALCLLALEDRLRAQLLLPLLRLEVAPRGFAVPEWILTTGRRGSQEGRASSTSIQTVSSFRYSPPTIGAHNGGLTATGAWLSGGCSSIHRGAGGKSATKSVHRRKGYGRSSVEDGRWDVVPPTPRKPQIGSALLAQTSLPNFASGLLRPRPLDLCTYVTIARHHRNNHALLGVWEFLGIEFAFPDAGRN